jgi:hypothetical protein
MLIRFGNNVWFFLGLSFIAAVFCYFPGSSGTFILDDFGSLEQLGDLKRIDNIDKLKQYVFGGTAGPGGRPFSLLTFAANAQTWPADPYPFLVTNIGIHVLNGLLVFYFLQILLTTAGINRNNTRFLAVAAAAFWVLHPFHVSTVLYVVQRMTLLAATFSLLTFIFYLKARDALNSEKVIPGVIHLLVAGIVALFGFFSKESAVLLPVQLFIIELFVKASNPTPNKGLQKVVVFGCLVPATIVVVGYPAKALLMHIWQYSQTGVDLTYNRTFGMFERLLTQQRILGDYLADLIIPKMQSAGVFFDGYPVSKSLISPFTTLTWALIHVVLIVIGWLVRKRTPILFFGIWWFYGSHIIESTVVMLELKFDHRNYLASIGVVLIIAYGLSQIGQTTKKIVIAASVAGLYGVLLLMSAQLWGQPLKAALVWVEKNPYSTRAIEHAVSEHMRIYGGDQTAEDLLRKSIQLSGQPTTELKFIDAFCKTYNGEPVDWESLANRIVNEQRDWALYNVMQRLLDNYLEKRCDLLELEGYRKLLHAYKLNPAYNQSSSLYIMEDLEVRAALAFEEPELAKQLVMDFRRDFIVPLAFQMNRALYLASYGELEFAIAELDRSIQIAEQLKNEFPLTVQNAKEILQLMRGELDNPSH